MNRHFQQIPLLIRQITRHSLLGASLVSITLLNGCGGSDGGSYTLSDAEPISVAVRNATEKTVVPEIGQFATQTQQLDSKVTDFCQTPTEPKLTDLQEVYKSTALAWHRIAMYNFGPLHQDVLFPRIHRIESMRQRGTDYSDTVRNDLNNFVSDSNLDNNFADKNFQFVGLLPIEIALFENQQTGATALSSVFTSFEQVPRKCLYLQGLTTDLQQQARSVLDEWQTDYPNPSLAEPQSYQAQLLNNQLNDDLPAENRYIIAIQEHLDYIKTRKLNGTLDAQLSGLTYEQILASLEAIEHFMRAEDDSDYRFFEHMQALGDTQAVETVETNLAQAKQFAQQQDRQQLAIALGALDGNFKREVPDALETTLGINFSDGD